MLYLEYFLLKDAKNNLENSPQFHTYSISVIPKLTSMVFSQRCCTDTIWQRAYHKIHVPAIKRGHRENGLYLYQYLHNQSDDRFSSLCLIVVDIFHHLTYLSAGGAS